MIPFVRRGLRCLLRRRIKVELLDALSISISACRRDFGTAGMVMFLLEVGELLEEWTRKKSVADLARSMSLNVDRVWLRTAQGEVLVPMSQIQPGDAVVVRAGGIVPVDGLVLEGRSPSIRRPSPASPSRCPSGPEAQSMPAPWWRRASVSWR